MSELRVVDVTEDGVMFERDGVQVFKTIGGTNKMSSLFRAARQADRDIAYTTHGEGYREHCEFQKDWWEGMPASEGRKLAHQIIAILEAKAALPNNE